jgi:hypothetical protein
LHVLLVMLEEGTMVLRICSSFSASAFSSAMLSGARPPARYLDSGYEKMFNQTLPTNL